MLEIRLPFIKSIPSIDERILTNFIIGSYHHDTTTCSFVESFLTACCSDVADLGNYKIHSVVLQA